MRPRFLPLVLALLHDINHFPFLHTFQELGAASFAEVSLLDLFCDGEATGDKPSLYQIVEEETGLGYASKVTTKNMAEQERGTFGPGFDAPDSGEPPLLNLSFICSIKIERIPCIKNPSGGSLKFRPLAAVQIFEFQFQFRQGAFDHLNKTPATRKHAAGRRHRVPLRMIVSHHQHFAVTAEPVRDPLDQLVSGLTGTRINDLHFRRGTKGRGGLFSARAIKYDGNRGAASIVIMSQAGD